MINFDLLIKHSSILIGLIVAIPLTIALIKNKGTVTYKNLSLSLGHKSTTDNRLKTISLNMNTQLEQIRHELFSGYLFLQKEQGCPEEILNENEDSEYVNQMLGNIVWSGNGIRSVKSIFEKCILNKEFMTMEYTQLIDSIMASIETNARKYINNNYRVKVNYTNATTRTRLISNTEWVDYLKKNLEKVRPIVDDFMTAARTLYLKGKK